MFYFLRILQKQELEIRNFNAESKSAKNSKQNSPSNF